MPDKKKTSAIATLPAINTIWKHSDFKDFVRIVDIRYDGPWPYRINGIGKNGDLGSAWVNASELKPVKKNK